MYDALAANKRRSALLIFVFILLVTAVGAALDVFTGFGGLAVLIALVVAVGTSVFSYWNADKVALAMSRARPADESQYQRLHNLVEGLAIAGGIPKPRVYIVDDAAPNAFATGRNPEHAAIAVTTGLLERMTRVELEGVLAHELAHIKNYDILVSTLAVTLVGVIALISDFGMRFMFFGNRRDRSSTGGAIAIPIVVLAIILLIASPLIAQFMRAAISRSRESFADVQAVNLTRYPPGLISALEKLRTDSTVVSSGSRATAHLWIESPLARKKGEGSLFRLNNLFETHPPLEERIEVLRQL